VFDERRFVFAQHHLDGGHQIDLEDCIEAAR
jgi:hypothetical protein